MRVVASELDLILALYPGARANMIRAREAAGLHPRIVAERLNVSYPYYRAIELGKAEPDEDVVRRLAMMLGAVDARELMRGGDGNGIDA